MYLQKMIITVRMHRQGANWRNIDTISNVGGIFTSCTGILSCRSNTCMKHKIVCKYVNL